MFFHRKGNSIRSIAFDCGTSGVRASLFSYPKKDILTKPEVSEAIRVPFLSTAYIDARLLKQRTRECIGYIAKKFSPSFRPQELVIGLSSPFYISKTVRFVQQRKVAKLPITLQEYEGFLAQAQDGFRKEAEKQVSGGEVVLFTVLPLKIYVNGYRVETLVGIPGKVIEVFFRFEATTRDVFDGFMEFFAHTWGHVPVHITSVSLANFYALRALYGEDEGFLVVDMGGEVSDISLIIGGVLERVTTLPLGYNMFVRETATLLGVSYEDASFVAGRYAEQALEAEKEKLLKPLIAEFESNWRKKLLTVLTAYAEQHEMPPRILLVGKVLLFHKGLFSEDAVRSLMLGKNITAELASARMLDRHFVRHPFQGPSDFGLASLTLLGARIVL